MANISLTTAPSLKLPNWKQLELEEDTKENTKEEEENMEEEVDDMEEENMEAAMEAAMEAKLEAELENELNFTSPTEAAADQVGNIRKYNFKLVKSNVEKIKSAFLNDCILCVNFQRERSYVSSYTEDIDVFLRDKNILENSALRRKSKLRARFKN